MKKSFMTRALATGLSLAMAFSLTAATNVTSASAAAKKPTMITYAGASAKSLDVKVGETVKIKVNAATKKNYKVSAVKVSSAKIAAKFNKAGTVVAITGKTATPEGKTASVKVSFKAKKTGKTSKYSYVSKVTVAEPVAEKQAIVSAAVTGVKTITLTMAKDVASVASPVAITVKKGTSEKAQKATAEGKTITLAMDNKLMAGDYTITIKGLETEELTATATVEKDEYLAGYKISPEASLKAVTTKSGGKTTTKASSQAAIVMYYALNQYDEPMLADEPNATSSFSSKTTVEKVATASEPGEILIDEIPTVLAIPGSSKGTMTLVDKAKGTNTTTEITISNMRSPKTVEVAGVYNINKNKIVDLTENAKIADHYILLTATDQYGWPVKEFTDDITINISGGLTNIGLANATTTQTTKNVVVDGKEYIAIVLAGVNGTVAQKGSYLVTIVNDKVGMLLNASYDVKEDVVAKSVSITAENGLYAGQKNELSYEVVDTNGNSIKDYETLVNIPVRFGSVNYADDKVATFSFVKQKDGSAKLIADLTAVDNDALGFTDAKQTTQSTIMSVVSYLNTTTGGNYTVTPFQLTVKKARTIVAAKGVKADQALEFAIGQKLTIDYSKLTFVDQYSNTITSDDDQFIDKAAITAGALKVGDVGLSVKVVTNDAVFSTATYGAIKDSKGFTFEAKGSDKAGTAVIYLKYAKGTEDKAVEATDQNYDARVIVSAVDTSGKESLKINSINDGDVVKVNAANSKGAITKDKIEVVSEVGGSKTIIPASQYDLISGDSASFTEAEIKAGTKTKTVTAEVLVTTWGKNGTEIHTTLKADYKVSWDGASVNKVSDVIKDQTITVGTIDGVKTVTAGALAQMFKFKDQYGVETTGALAYTNKSMDMGGVKYTVVPKYLTSDQYKIVSNGENAIRMTASVASGAAVAVEVTAEVNGASKTVDGYLKF